MEQRSIDGLHVSQKHNVHIVGVKCKLWHDISQLLPSNFTKEEATNVTISKSSLSINLCYFY